MKNRRPKVIGYRLADVRPYGPTGEYLEVTPLPAFWGKHDAPERLAIRLDACMIELRRGGLSSADPAGRPRLGWWCVVCAGGEVELSFTTWQSAARAWDRILRHRECRHEHQVITRHSDVIAIFASEKASD
ncbi:hypothetical protein [Nonomuraea sp. NPDC005650]|uniref:hypothetical protein n=1 Tax=Nonomuraea sp. NPDC005650 TaxID=3157045 RepID=UPI0033A7307A